MQESSAQTNARTINAFPICPKMRCSPVYCMYGVKVVYGRKVKSKFFGGASPSFARGRAVRYNSALPAKMPAFGGVSATIPCAADAFCKKTKSNFLLIPKGFKVYRKPNHIEFSC